MVRNSTNFDGLSGIINDYDNKRIKKVVLLSLIFLLSIFSSFFVEGSLNTSLKSYYNLDGDVNDVFKIANGSSSGSPPVVTGIILNAYNTTTSKYLTLPTNHYNITNTNSVASVSLWFNSETSNAWQRIYEYGSTTNYVIQKMGTGQGCDNCIRFLVFSGGAKVDLKYNYGDTSGWHHVVVSTGSANSTMYFDGVQVATASKGSVSQSAYAGTLGSHGARNGEYFTGRIDEVGFWNGKALNSSEVTELYNNGSGLTYPFVPLVPVIYLNSISPLNNTYTNLTTPVFSFNVTGIVDVPSFNASLFVGGVNKGSNNSLNSTGVYTITSSALSTGAEYEWYINVTSGTYSNRTVINKLYIIGNATPASSSCVVDLGNEYYRPNNCGDI
jgi:hypothetical protein